MNTLHDSLVLAWQLIAGLDAALLRIVALSLQVSGTACLIGAVFGLWLGAWLAVARFRGHGLLVWAVNTLLALPPVVVGLLVYLLLSRTGPLGELGILFTPSAMVVAQSVLVVPLIAALSLRLVRSALLDGGEQLRSLGAGPVQSALLMLLHERLGVLTVLLTAFGRAVAEVGAVMIVGGNIDGVTRVMTTAIALETSKGDLPLALALGIVLLAVVGVVNGLIGLVQVRGRRIHDAPVAASAVTKAPPPAAAPRRVPTGEVLVVLHEASVDFDGVQALRQASFTLHRGECVALVGANGSGKTTLLRLLHGLVDAQAPDSGRVERHALQREGRLPVLAMLFQRPFLLSLSVRRNLLLGLWLRGVPPAERPARVADALRRVGLDALAERPARALSGGQQQRLALARAWALQPDVLLLDEPTASLDPSAKREIEALVEEISAAGVTVVLSTHNLGQVKRLATRVVYLEHGRIVVDLPTARFFSDQLPPEADQFLRGELPWA
ncbi:ABC transporter permease [Rubrivivax sp. RP6-9]|uniref:ABC transporter permease n=1 Tax=Rubrivivax sp. RP6-9 TaxID=3415750 RepID=UPI003CC615CB